MNEIAHLIFMKMACPYKKHKLSNNFSNIIYIISLILYFIRAKVITLCFHNIT